MKALSGATIITTFGLFSSYQITKRIEKKGWKEIEQKVQKPLITDENTKNNCMFIKREIIENTLHKELKGSEKVRTCLVSSPKHFGKTTMIKHAFLQSKSPYIYLDLHDVETSDKNAFVSVLEDNMNDPQWFRLLMRKFHPKYHNYVMQRWVNNIRALASEIDIKQQQNTSSYPWIVIDGIDSSDITNNEQFKDDISLLNQQLAKEFATASVLLSVSSESALKSQHLFANKTCKWDNYIWISQFQSREHALQYIQSKLAHLKHIQENHIHVLIDFCRLNIADINYCIEEICKANHRDSDSESQPVLFDEIWSDIKQKRMHYYKINSPLLEWNDIQFWMQFVHESMDTNGEISQQFEWNVCKYLLYDYFTSVVVVGSTATDIIQHFSGNIDIVMELYKNGCFFRYDASAVPPFELMDESVCMPASHAQFKAFEEILKDNPLLSGMILLVSRHYIFTRELRRAQQDIDRIKGEIEVFGAAQSHLEKQKNELNVEQRTNLEIEILSKNKSFDTKLNEAVRRKTYFHNAKVDNLEKFKKMAKQPRIENDSMQISTL